MHRLLLLQPRKAKFAKAGKSLQKNNKKTVNGDFKFGVDGAHKNQGKKSKSSPMGGPMVLSRRLSRRIMKGSPLRCVGIRVCVP